ncbi:MAG: YraN family protein [Streptosporangiaceae bacterium]
MNPKDELGRVGEQLAAEFLERCELRILDRNWRCPAGEIDIVALEWRVLVICEVKTRSGGRYGTPLEAISARKLARLRKLAVAWVTARGLFYEEIRIDLVGVVRVAPGEFSIEHVRGVG